MTATPRIDAVEAWVRAGRVGPIDWPASEHVPMTHPNPVEWFDPDVRLEAALRMIGGAPAELATKPFGRTAPRRRWRRKR